MITEADRSAFVQRATTIDYACLDHLHCLGNYRRRLPVNMVRMIENAYDWEHLPHVHASSFASIECIDSGGWGWRAKAQLPGGEAQLLELLVDGERYYWATTVLAGPASGMQVHTQATTLSEQEIEVDVRFYSDQPVADEEVPVYLELMQHQYALLYDEDVMLMRGRQQALDQRARLRELPTLSDILVGNTVELQEQGGATVETPRGRFCVRLHRGNWVVYSAVCSHQLGPLDESSIAADGSITCPWHGYRFDAASGDNLDGKCRALATAPGARVSAESLYLHWD